MLTVSADQDDVEGRLGAGGLACPACSGVLARWGGRGSVISAARAGWLSGCGCGGRLPWLRADACAAAGDVPGAPG
jgi:hypothetical protein